MQTEVAIPRKRFIRICLASGLVLMSFPVKAQQAPDFTYTTNNGTIAITSYVGSGGAITIPSVIDGLPVTAVEHLTGDPGDVTSVTFPGSVTNISGGMFNGSGLTGVTVDPLNPVYSSLDGVLFDKDQTIILACPRGKTGDFTIPNTVTNIPDGLFSDCFYLSGISVDPLNPFYSSVDGVLFDKGQTAIIQCPRGKTGTVTIPEGVGVIQDNAFFGCAQLTGLTIGSGVTNIGE